MKSLSQHARLPIMLLGLALTTALVSYATLPANSLAPQPDAFTDHDCRITGCAACKNDGCDLDPGQWTLPSTAPTSTVYRCIDFDNVFPAHCCAVTQTPVEIWQYGTDTNYETGQRIPENIGNCYRLKCAKGSPTDIKCTDYDTEGQSRLGSDRDKHHRYTHGKNTGKGKL